MADTVLQIGLLGCGKIAQFAHLPALARSRRVKLVALCDAADDLREAVGRRAGVSRSYKSDDDLLADPQVHAVLIAVPDAFHASLAAKALQAGKHVLVEKPLGANSTECIRLAQLVRETDLTLQVGSMKRHDPGVAFAHQFLRKTAGRVLSVSAVYRDSLFRSAMQDSCLDRPIVSQHALKPSEDPKTDLQHYNLVTQGAHLFDLILFLGDEVRAVTAQCAQVAGQWSWHGLLEFAGGGRGHFELTSKSCGDWCEQYVVLGEGGSAEVQVSLPFFHRPSKARAFDGRTQQWVQPLGSSSNAYVNQLEAFAATVLDHQAANPDVFAGLAVMRLLEGVEQSVATGARIEIPPAEVK